MSVAAVNFDLDGVLLDSEGAWAEAKRKFVLEHGGHWDDGAVEAMMGMSSTEWSTYLRDELGVEMDPRAISDAVVADIHDLYRERLPLLPGAREAVLRLAGVWPLGLASSSNRPVIDSFLELSGLAGSFAATVSSEEVPSGKPAPDVYLECARRLSVDPGQCVAVEDSSPGLRSASAAGMVVIAIPNREFPPDGDAVHLADEVLDSLDQLTPELLRSAS